MGNRLTYTSALSNTVYCLNDGRVTSLIDEGITGIYGIVAEPRIASLPSQQPPSVYEAHAFKAREIVVHLAIQDCGAVVSALDWWKDFMADVRADAINGTPGVLTYTDENFTTRAIRAAISQDAEGISRVGDYGVNRHVWETKLTFLCADPTFYDPALKVATGAFNGANEVDILCTNAGDVPAYPSILYATNAVNKLSLPVCEWSGGYYYIVLGELETNQTLLTVADPGNWSITYSGSPSDWSGLRYGYLPIIVPGSENLTFAADNVSADADITISWHDRYSFFH